MEERLEPRDIRDLIIDHLKSPESGIDHFLNVIDAKRKESTPKTRCVDFYDNGNIYPAVFVDIDDSTFEEDGISSNSYELLQEELPVEITGIINDDRRESANYLENYIKAIIKSVELIEHEQIQKIKMKRTIRNKLYQYDEEKRVSPKRRGVYQLGGLIIEVIIRK